MSSVVTFHAQARPVVRVSQTSSASSARITTPLLQLHYPSRPCFYTMWECPSEPMVVTPTLLTRYEPPFMAVVANGAPPPVLPPNQQQQDAWGGIFDNELFIWMRRVVATLRREVKSMTTRFLAKLSLKILRCRH